MTILNFQSDTSPARLTPNLGITDSSAAYWFAQVTLRLRREVAWCWHQRTPHADPGMGKLPPLVDAAAENLDIVRYENQKEIFFGKDPAARYLSDEINDLQHNKDPQSCWQMVVSELDLDRAAEFVMALGLAVYLDAGLAPVFSTCMNDLNRPFATLALAQRLWDEPLQIVDCSDPDHPLCRYGLLANINNGAGGPIWHRPLDIPAIVARLLIDPEAPLPQAAQLIECAEKRDLDRSGQMLAARLRADVNNGMQIVPLLGAPGVAFADWAATLGQELERQVVALDGSMVVESVDLSAMASVCWMMGLDILIPEQWVSNDKFQDKFVLLAPAMAIPIRWYVPISEQSQIKNLPAKVTTPALKIPDLDFFERVRKLKQELGGQALGLDSAVEECARRFRLQEQMIERVSRTFADSRMHLTGDSLVLACSNEATVALDNLAQQVKPRFGPDELVLPDEQTRQFQEILHAMQSLTVVHYHWGTAKAWNESGIAVLFYGSPGTGKTMAAEALGTALNLPMFRIDLSQVVNKYIGETEKNLKRIFDAAELSDCLLFFDEADALFGKRTEVKDAHDRFANIEISYLLERMERFKGLAILATNRRKDLDDAFLRRLRFIIEFPTPGLKERQRIWQMVFPEKVDVSDIDFPYLAKQFQLSGGYIRSIAFNACLRSARAGSPQSASKMLMPDLLMAVKRELEKMNRTAGDELFGKYSAMIKEMPP
ncbi:MAG: ATP-binding protein [Desulfobulbaceae bacterium]|nr:ATP-binding protein [Desulfobulbaceae bacterium]